MENLQARGFEAYLVGGGVRDLLLGHTPKDFDIATSALPEEVKATFSRCFLIGRRFRLAHVRFGNKVIEVATFRSGDPLEENLITHDNTWGTPEEDAIRRDFTINGLFYNSKDQTIIDFVQGFESIEKKELKVIGVPHLRFKQDPVRMIRLVKFEARFGLAIDHDAHMALLACRKEIIKSSQARIFEEIFRMLESGAAARFFKLLVQYELLSPMLPTLSSFLEKPEGSVFYTYLEHVDKLIGQRTTPLPRPLLLAAMLYPILENHLLHLSENTKTVPLSEIHKLANLLIFDFFHPFFLVPRKLRQITCYILVYQYRMTPLKPTTRKKVRIPQSENFDLALYFFYIRTLSHDDLKPVYRNWLEAYQNLKEKKQIKKRPSH